MIISLLLLLLLAAAALAVTFFRVNRTVTIRGVFEYRASCPIVVREPGFVQDVVAEVDQRVTEGDVLLILENRDLDMEIKSLRNQLSVYELELERLADQKDHDVFQTRQDILLLRERLQVKTIELEHRESLFISYRELHRTKSIMRNQYDEVRLAYLSVRAEIAELEIELVKKNNALGELETTASGLVALKKKDHDIARERLSHLIGRHENLVITAPEPGVLLAEDWGDLRSSYMGPGTHVADIVSLDQIDFVGFATDADIIRIREGQDAYFDVDVFRRKAFVNGTVTKVGHLAMEAEGRSLFPVRIEIANTTFFDRGQRLYIQAGVSAEAVVITEKGLSLIQLVWEKVRKLTDFQVYAQ